MRSRKTQRTERRHVRYRPDDSNDAWQLQADKVVWEFSETLKRLHDTNPWPNMPLLDQAMAHLMTELWDRGFSQTEIRTAFENAVAAMPAYAAGEDRRY